MYQTLKNICDRLGVPYPDIALYLTDCAKAEYLIKQIEIFIGG